MSDMTTGSRNEPLKVFTVELAGEKVTMMATMCEIKSGSVPTQVILLEAANEEA